MHQMGRIMALEAFVMRNGVGPDPGLNRTRRRENRDSREKHGGAWPTMAAVVGRLYPQRRSTRI